MRQLSSASCSTHRFILYLSLDTSAWLLAIITIERFIAVCRPQKHKAIRTANMAVKIIASLLLVQIAFNIHVFWTRGTHYEQLESQKLSVDAHCGYTSRSTRYFWTNHQGWLSMVWYCFIPFSTMFILNIFIIRRLRRLKDSSLQRNASGMSSTGITKQANSMTRMLLCVTLYFMVVSVPVFVFTMFQHLLFYNNDAVDDHRIAKMELADASLTLLLYLNHSVNFFLYCLTGRRFRRELKVMFGFLKSFPQIGSTKKKKRSSIREPSPAKQKGDQNFLDPSYHALTTGSSPVMNRSTNNETTTSVNISGL